MKNPHKHHIIPDYRCKELGMAPGYKIDGVEFYFKENMVRVEQIDHARIHWGYWCDDLEPLFEYVTPAQWIIDLIPRGDYRDSHAAIPNALGAIDGIEPARGKDCPDYIPVLDLDGNEVEGSEDWPEKKRYYYRKCISEGIQPKTHEERAIIREEKELIYKKGVEEREEIRRIWKLTAPERRAEYMREYNKTHKQTSEYKEQNREYMKEYMRKRRVEMNPDVDIRRKEREKKLQVIEQKKTKKLIERLEKETQNQLIAKEKGIKVKSVYGLRSYYKLREEGIDPNKKYRESHREENKDYAKWYYHNVQKPKNAKK